MRIPLDRLPMDAAARHGVLRDYFCDKDATARVLDGAWELDLSWSDEAARYIDPALDAGLAWWGNRVSRNTMGLALRADRGVATALHDTWTLYQWSLWIAANPTAVTGPMTVLHIDDHRDIASPRLFMRRGELIDPLSGQPVRISEPESVRSAIESGAIGMGSFLTPFLHAYPQTEVRHLCQPPKVTRTEDFLIVPTSVADTLIDPGASRPAIRLDPADRGSGTGRYRLTADLTRWLESLCDGPLLLHIDMDYFNNRYDGDSDWGARGARLDPPLPAVLDRIDEVVAALEARAGQRLADVTIAYSPGFFPAEYWAAVDERLRQGIHRIYGHR